MKFLRYSWKDLNMPVISVDGPAVPNVDRKREFVRLVTDAAVALYEIPRQAIIVLFRENTPENVGVGGELLVDRFDKGSVDRR
jgi:4-oxalocrotonate tautomerase